MPNRPLSSTGQARATLFIRIRQDLSNRTLFLSLMRAGLTLTLLLIPLITINPIFLLLLHRNRLQILLLVALPTTALAACIYPHHHIPIYAMDKLLEISRTLGL